jgi:hypothetical protein
MRRHSRLDLANEHLRTSTAATVTTARVRERGVCASGGWGSTAGGGADRGVYYEGSTTTVGLEPNRPIPSDSC